MLLSLRRFQNPANTATSLLRLAPPARPHVHSIRIDEAVFDQGRRIPFGAGDGANVKDVHGIDFLERSTFSLDHEEVDDEEEDDE